VGGQRNTPAALPPVKNQYPLYRRLGGHQGGSKNLAPTGIRSPDRPALSESLYRLSYPGPYYMVPNLNMHSKAWIMTTDQRQLLFLSPNDTVVYGIRRRVLCSISTSLMEDLQRRSYLWKWRQQIFLHRWYLFTTLHDFRLQETIITLTADISWNFTGGITKSYISTQIHSPVPSNLMLNVHHYDKQQRSVSCSWEAFITARVLLCLCMLLAGYMYFIRLPMDSPFHMLTAAQFFCCA
jgi:hypothetical protein